VAIALSHQNDKAMLSKFSLFTLAIFATFSGLRATPVCAQSTDSAVVDLASQLRFNGKKVSNYTLIIYCDTTAAETIFVEKAKVIHIPLRYNHNYTLRYLKEGFRERVLLVNTFVDKKTSCIDASFDYQIALIPENAPPNTLGDLPVAIIRYDKIARKFDYSRKYHHQVRQKNEGLITNR
jgi:hypothetical protein